MADWGGIIAGALGGAAQGVGNLAAGAIEDERKLSVQQQIAKMQEEAAIRAEQRAAQAYKDRKKFDLSPEVTAGLVAQETAVGKVRVDQAVDQATRIGRVQTDEELRRAQDPAYLAAQRALARARHVESSAALEQAALARLQRENLEKASRLRDKLAAARAAGNEDEVESLRQQITDLAYSGKDTAGAYRTYSSAMTRLSELEAKLSAAEPAEAARIRQDIEEQRAVLRTAAKDLGVKLPDAKGGAAPPVGTVVDGFRFKGGDPNDKANWEPANRKPAGLVENARGPFTDDKGRTQLLQPLYDMNDWRRNLQQGTNADPTSLGY